MTDAEGDAHFTDIIGDGDGPRLVALWCSAAGMAVTAPHPALS